MHFALHILFSLLDYVLALRVNNNMKACIVSGKRRRKRNSINHEEFALANYDGPLYHARELTKDHHPNREDERNRVEAAGGYVLEWAGVYRVNGELALSRAIGDVPYKRLMAAPILFHEL
jgi:hypothetical protein